MESKCKECKQKEAHMFWSQRESTRHRFFKVLMGDFRLHLSIPPKFVTNFNELADTMVLRGPSGNSWRVGLKRMDNKMYFEHGWPTFVQDHNLEETNILVFRYAGDSIFDVMMFDLSCCEKESSYFVKSNGGSSSNPERKVKAKNMGEPKENHEERSNRAKMVDHTKSPVFTRADSVQFEGKEKRLQRSGDASAHPKTKTKFDAGSVNDNTSTSSDTDISDDEADDDDDNEDDVDDEDTDSSNSKGDDDEEEDDVDDEETDSSNSKGSSTNVLPSYVDKKLSYPYYFITTRRPVADAEKFRAKKAAYAVKSNKPSFVQVMKQTNVYKGFRLGIPIRWAREYLPNKSQDVNLTVSWSQKQWVVEFQVRTVGATLEKGWSIFVMDNNLEEGDACLFKLCQGGKRSNDIIVMDVSIFRVVEEAVPLTKYIPLRSMQNPY